MIEHASTKAVLNWVADRAAIQISLINNKATLSPEEKNHRMDLIWRKIVHTGDVVHASELIQRSRNDSDAAIIIGSIIALDHDEARFREAAKFGKWVSLKVFNHARVAAQKFQRVASRFGISESDTQEIYRAVYDHADTNETTHYFTQLIEDADKLANWLRLEYKWEYGDGNMLPNTPFISEQVLDDFRAKKMIQNDDCKTRFDLFLRSLAWIHQVYLPETLQIAQRDEVFESMFEKLDRYIPERAVEIRRLTNQFLTERLTDLNSLAVALT